MSVRITPETVSPDAVVFKGTRSGRAGRRISRIPDVLPLTLEEVEARKLWLQKLKPSYDQNFLKLTADGGGVMGFVALASQ